MREYQNLGLKFDELSERVQFGKIFKKKSQIVRTASHDYLFVITMTKLSTWCFPVLVGRHFPCQHFFLFKPKFGAFVRIPHSAFA